MSELTISTNNQLLNGASVAQLGQAANEVAAKTTFQRELAGKAKNTRISYQKDLETWAEYLSLAGADVVDCDWYGDPECWAGVTHGLVLGFAAWMQQNAFAIASINRKLSTVRKFCAMAAQAGVTTPAPLP
ncbi:MAG: site-specific integrase [Caldilineaceae bacterium]